MTTPRTGGPSTIPGRHRTTMERQPDTDDITLLPLLGILATTNVTLDSLIGGLQDHYQELLDSPPNNLDSCEPHHNARVAIALAQTLQVIVSRLCAHELELVAPSEDNYF